MNEGKIRPLAVTSAERAPFLPNVPTMAESGYPGYEVPGWFGMVAPARTPDAVIDRLNRETVKIMALPDVREKLHAIGIVALADTPAEFAAEIKKETSYWAKVIKDTGIRPIE
jgi:tripartite-type tricarboxylate transporter receptor subunit TctC